MKFYNMCGVSREMYIHPKRHDNA